MEKVKDEELRYGQFFIERLNNHYGLDYIIRTNNDRENKKDPEVDVFAISAKHPILRLQVVTREKIIHEECAKLRKEAKRTKKNAVRGPLIDMEMEKWIIQAIKKKENKYPNKLKHELVLLVIGDIGPLFNENYAKQIFRDFINSEFKGIYLVHFPSKDQEQSNYIHNGQVIAIRDIFGNHGLSL